MGWNDRLPEDPYWPEVSQQDDRDSYENWLAYIEGQLDDANAELSSQNLTLEDLRRLTGVRILRTDEQTHENEDSRQSTYHQKERDDRTAQTSPDSQNV